MVPNPMVSERPAESDHVIESDRMVGSEGRELAVDFAALESVSDALAAAALALARRFAAGATMWCVAPSWPAHGRHVAVEFVHPVIMGKRALPAIFVGDVDVVASLRLLARPGDIVVVLGREDEEEIASLLRRGDAWGLTTVWIGGGPHPPASTADHLLWVDGADADVVGSSGGFVLLYHLLWELVHVVFEHPGLLAEPAPVCEGDVCITCSDEGRVVEVAEMGDDSMAVVLAQGRRESVDTTLVGRPAPGELLLVHAGTAIAAGGGAAAMTAEPTNFLYPFIDSEERDSGSLLVDLAASARGKMAQSRELQLATLARWAPVLETLAAEMAERFAAGGRLYTFGNGGSATDAEMTAQMFRHPLAGRALPAWPLVEDRAVLTALANDVGFELVFSRQLIAHARAGDMALGLSTSGNSDNVMRAFAEAKHRGLLTVGLAGYDGGAMANNANVDYCLIVRSDSVHRIQEAQDALVYELWSATQRHLADHSTLKGSST